MGRAFILTIDGGGVRGLVPAVVLREVHRRLMVRRPDLHQIHRCFDLVAGTSVGALITSLITTPAEPGSPQAMMQPDAVPAFLRKSFPSIFPAGTFRRRRSSTDTTRSAYEPAGDAGAQHDAYKGATVEAALTRVLYTAYDPERREPLLVTGTGRDGTAAMPLRDLIKGATAAPTFHGPARTVGRDTGSMRTLIDGSVFMNDPAVAALGHAVSLGMDPENIVVLSLGTGRPSNAYAFDEVNSWEIDDWVSPKRAFPVFSMLTSGQSAATALVMEQLLNTPGRPRRYIKIDGPLTAGSDNIDDASDRNMDELECFGSALIERFGAAIDEVCAAIASDVETQPA